MQYTPVPQEVFSPCDKAGTLEAFTYESRGQQKSALVYLPHGYVGGTAEYPVLYLMHGGGGDENEFFGGLEAKSGLKNLLDNMIATERCRPMIVVAPTYLIKGVQGARREIGEAMRLTHRFHEEFREDLVPAIQAHFRAADDRTMRAFGGFSMGGETTWSVFANAADLVHTILPLSGDYWAMGLKGGKDFPEETADALIASLQSLGVTPGDYRVLPCTGDKDIAYEALDPMVHALEKRQPWFTPGETPENGNLCYLLNPDGWHTYDDCFEYLYHIAPWIFA